MDKQTDVMENLIKLDGQELSSEQWHNLRHDKETKLISMLGQANENNKVKHSVIFHNKKQIFVYV